MFMTLEFNWSCKNIIDVSALGNSPYISFRSECKKIIDVSALGNIHTLDLNRL